MKKPPDIPL